MFKEEKKVITSWWIYFLGMIIFSVLALSVLKYMGLVGTTIVEREVFEQSYQRSETMKSREIAYTAQLSAVESQLSVETDEDIIKQLKVQKAMLNTQINQTRGMK